MYYLIFFLYHIHIIYIPMASFLFCEDENNFCENHSNRIFFFFWTFLPFFTNFLLYVQFLWIADLYYIYMSIHIIYTYLQTTTTRIIRGLEKITNRYIVVVNLLSLRMTPKRGECCTFFFFLFIIIVKTARRPSRAGVENLLAVRHDCTTVCMQI